MLKSQRDVTAVRMPWQDDQWHRMTELHASSKLPHALLFAGAPGTGKHRFLLSLCHYLMCQSPVAGLACQECKQCQLLATGDHPDLKWLAPEEKSRQIKVDQVRAVVDFLGHTSQQGGYKIAVVTPAEAMNINAANALLKSLEEPTDKTLLFLISDRPGQLLPTIRSRCQHVNFPVPPQEQSLQWLSGVVPGQTDANALLYEASGQPLTALDLLSNDGLERRAQLDGDYRSVLQGSSSPLVIAEKWLEYDLDEVLVWLIGQLSELIKMKVASPAAEASLKERDRWRDVIEKTDIRGVYSLLDSIHSTRNAVNRGGNPNRQLMLEQILFESCEKFNS
ncbi:MAG: DNA polymerase III subunit delta' [Oceanicoccus sp.]